MGRASFLVSSFLGGVWSQSAQGAITDPRYKTALNVSLNELPIEAGANTRRPGTAFAGTTRGGAAGRVITFDFKESSPYTMEFTDGYLRFRNGTSMVMTNDQQAVSAISTDNPAKVTVLAAWATGTVVMFNSLGANNPLLQNRRFTITNVDSTHFTIADALTGTAIDGSTLGTFVSGNVTRILEIVTTYTNGSWASLRSVQAETQTVLMNGFARPQILAVTQLPTPTSFANFSLTAFNFIDGPYLDPVANSTLTPSATNGVVTMTLSAQAYDSGRAYNIGDFVLSSGTVYVSLAAANQNNTPASSPSSWAATSAGAQVNRGQGIISSDIGRLVRFFSEPSLWISGHTYSAGDVVSFPDPSADGDGVNLYYTSTAGSNTATPGTSTNWALTPTAATWSWGKITAVSGAGLISSDTPMGNMSAGGGVTAAFDGTNSQPYASSASATSSIDAAPAFVGGGSYSATNRVYYGGNIYQAAQTSVAWVSGGSYVLNEIVNYMGVYYKSGSTFSGFTVPPPSQPVLWQNVGAENPTNTNVWSFVEAAPQPSTALYVGQHYGTAKSIFQATVYPASDIGFANTAGNITLNLRGKSSSPASSSDGTLLGTTTISNQFGAVTIPSNDTSTTWHYVWIEMVATYAQPLTPTSGYSFTSKQSVSQVLFYAPNVANGSVFSVQVEGPALLYTSAIRIWRLGLYSDTTGWPTNGVYHEGRLWLSGAVDNRIDGSAVGLTGGILNFAPTTAGGVVTDANAIAYTFDAKDVNAIFWMEPDQQGIICGTQAGEWLVQATTANVPLTPTTIQAHRVTKIGCANIEPRRSEHTLLFVQKHRRKVMEYFADVFSGKFSAPNLSEKAKHLTKPNIAEIAYVQELAPVLWARCDDGSLIGCTYKRESLTSAQGPTFAGWHRHALGSGRLTESICAGPSQDGNLDTLSLVTNDTATSIRHVELLTNLFEEGNALVNAWFLDDAVAPSSYSVAVALGGASGVTFNGLWHLNGKTVTVFAGGLDVGDWAVSNGSVNVPFAPSTLQTNTLFTQAFVSAFSGAMPCVIGCGYTRQGQLVPPDTQLESGARTGPGFGKNKRIDTFAVSLVDAQAISFGTDFTRLNATQLKTPGKSALLAANVLFNGVHKDKVNDKGDDYDGAQLCWQQTRPFPATVAGISGFITTSDE